MTDKTDFHNHMERLVRLESKVDMFQHEMRGRLRNIDDNIELLLKEYHERQGERNLARILIGVIGAVSGGVAGWVSHFWWNHP